MIKNPFLLTGKNILITGASSGIGRQCAISCSQMGAKVVLIARNEERLKETLAMMEGEEHCIVVLDLTDYKLTETIVKEIVNKVGRIDGVLHCAGISTTLPLKLVDSEKMEDFFHANVFSAYNLSKEVCKVGHFSKKGGSIVFFSSIMGIVGENGKSLYSMTKGALLSATRSLACELAKKNIRVNSISPGVVITPINKDLPHIADPDKRTILEKKHLLGLGEPIDVANTCVFLLSDASRWITGQNIIVDGGYTAQ